VPATRLRREETKRQHVVNEPAGAVCEVAASKPDIIRFYPMHSLSGIWPTSVSFNYLFVRFPPFIRCLPRLTFSSISLSTVLSLFLLRHLISFLSLIFFSSLSPTRLIRTLLSLLLTFLSFVFVSSNFAERCSQAAGTPPTYSRDKSYPCNRP
jgi:hypothetical protein